MIYNRDFALSFDCDWDIFSWTCLLEAPVISSHLASNFSDGTQGIMVEKTSGFQLVKRPWSMVMVQPQRVSWFKYVQITMWISLEATREARPCQGSRGRRNLSLLRPRLSSASFIRFIYRKVLPANRRIRPTLCLEGQDGGPCGLVRNEILELFISR